MLTCRVARVVNVTLNSQTQGSQRDDTDYPNPQSSVELWFQGKSVCTVIAVSPPAVLTELSLWLTVGSPRLPSPVRTQDITGDMYFTSPLQALLEYSSNASETLRLTSENILLLVADVYHLSQVRVRDG